MLSTPDKFRAYLAGDGNDNIYDDEYTHPLIDFVSHTSDDTIYLNSPTTAIYNEVEVELPDWVYLFRQAWITHLFDYISEFGYADGQVALDLLDDLE